MADTQVTFRDTLIRIVPWWLRKGTARKVLWGIGVLMDQIVDSATAAARLEFPNVDSADSLPAIGRERRIPRGPAEPADIYASRLTRWLDDHRTRGGPYALLEQMGRFYSAIPFDMDLYYTSGRHFRRAADGTITRDIGSPYDLDLAKWARWWLHIHWPTDLVDDGLWSDPGVYDDAGVWDTASLTPTDVTALRTVPSTWNAAHTQGTLVLVDSDGGVWDFPPELWSDPGTWDSGDTAIRIAVE